MMKPTAARKLDIVLRSAAGLKKVSTSRMAAYAVAWIEPSVRVPSPMDKRHGRNPVWDATISMTLDERFLSQAAKRLHIELLGQGLVSTTPIGFVTVDMTDILSRGSNGSAVRAPFPEHPVRRRSGRQQGILNFELCLQASSTHIPASGAPPQEEKLAKDPPAELSPSSSPPTLPQHRREFIMEPQHRRELSMEPQYRRELSMEPRQYESQQARRDISRKPIDTSRSRESEDYAFGAPTSRLGYGVGEHEEVSLLGAYDSATVASHFR